jgi:hypothetical protein
MVHHQALDDIVAQAVGIGPKGIIVALAEQLS